MDGNWRQGAAGLAAGVLCAAMLSAAFLAGLGDLLEAYRRFCVRLGDIGIIGMIPLAVAVVIGPGLLWWGLAVVILRLLGERE
jgi:hypothetical protein